MSRVQETALARPHFPIVLVMVVLLVSLAIRISALWTPHWRGDQAQYLILAMKLRHEGLSGYNLRGAAMGYSDVMAGEGNRISFSLVKPSAEEKPGTYLTMLKKMGQAYYDEPLHVRAPLFPAILAFSHKLFVGSSVLGQPTVEPVVAVLSYGPKTWKQVTASWRLWRYQLWASMVPLVFNLALIFLTAVLAWAFFGSRRITVLAAAILGGNPLSIWLAHKILTEDTTAFFVTAAIAAFGLLWKRSHSLSGLAVGMLSGVAVLVNQRAGLMLPAIGIFACSCIWQDTLVRSGSNALLSVSTRIGKVVSDRFFWMTGLAFTAVTGFWFYKVYRTYGHPLHQPAEGMLEALTSDVTGWFAAVHSRPHPAILFSIGAIFLCPLFGPALCTWNQSWGSWTGRLKDSQSRSVALLWVWVMLLFFLLANPTSIFITGNQEHRYFYPAYPALAILSAFGLDKCLKRMKPKKMLGNSSVEGIIITVLILAGAVWGAWLAYPKIFADKMLF